MSSRDSGLLAWGPGLGKCCLILPAPADVALSRCVGKTLALASGWRLTTGKARLMSGGNPHGPAGNGTSMRSRPNLVFQPHPPAGLAVLLSPVLHSCALPWEAIHPCPGAWHSQLSRPPVARVPTTVLRTRPSKLPQRFSAALASSPPSAMGPPRDKQRCAAHYRPRAAYRGQLA